MSRKITTGVAVFAAGTALLAAALFTAAAIADDELSFNTSVRSGW